MNTPTRIFCSVIIFAAAISESRSEDWSALPCNAPTPWTAQVSPQTVQGEYPRPQLVRKDWLSLNGLWEYSIVSKTEEATVLSKGKIRVPFPVESPLSGVGKTVGPENELIYQRSFTVPEEWKGKNVILNFEAVDWQTEVLVNGKSAGKHQGGYTPFSFDITEFLASGGQQLLQVKVYDPTDASWQPRGTQNRSVNLQPGAEVTGIWDAVWLEPVSPEAYLSDIWAAAGKKAGDTFITSADGAVFISGSVMRTEESKVCITVFDSQNKKISEKEAPVQAFGYFGAQIQIDTPHLWTPENPYLYRVKVEVHTATALVDTAESYFGIRTVSIGTDAEGTNRILLNGKPVFQLGVLDSGWFPDGYYTAPSEEALKSDLQAVKDAGFNLIRKYQKVAPRRYYYWCDTIGLLVWQDMPSGDAAIAQGEKDMVRSDASEKNFYVEWGEIIETLRNSPSIIMWIPFNQGVGQFQTAQVIQWTKAQDPTRLTDGASGWEDRQSGDALDLHSLPVFRNFFWTKGRAVIIGKFFDWKNADADNSLEKSPRCKAEFEKILQPYIEKGLSGAVVIPLTNWYDAETGLLPPDRK